MSLRKKLLSGFGAMIALVFVLSVAALLVIGDLNGDLERAASVTARKQYLAGNVHAAASDMTSLERGSVLAVTLGDKPHSDAYLQQFQEAQTRLQDALSDLRKTAETKEAEALLETLDQQSSLVAQAHEELRQAMANQQMDAALSIFAQKVQPRLEEIGREAVVAGGTAESGSGVGIGSLRRQVGAQPDSTIGLMLAGRGGGPAVFWMVRKATDLCRVMAGRMAESAEQVAGAASQVSGASQSLAQGASEQAASLEETSASTEEIASITRKNADHALASGRA